MRRQHGHDRARDVLVMRRRALVRRLECARQHGASGGCCCHWRISAADQEGREDDLIHPDQEAVSANDTNRYDRPDQSSHHGEYQSRRVGSAAAKRFVKTVKPLSWRFTVANSPTNLRTSLALQV